MDDGTKGVAVVVRIYDFQFINWFPYWQGIKVVSWKNRPFPFLHWSILFGFFEIRKWKDGERPGR